MLLVRPRRSAQCCAALRAGRMPQYALQDLAPHTDAAASSTLHTMGRQGGVTALHVQAKHAEWNELFAKCAARSVQTHPHAHARTHAHA